MTAARVSIARAGVALVAILASAGAASAQESLAPSASWALAPSFTSWRFSTPLAQSAGNLKSVTELALPFGARAELGRFTFDMRAAAAMSSATVEDADGNSQKLTLNGITDVRLRASVPVFGEGVVLTAGLNVPTGSTGLDASQSNVLQFISAPALGLPVPNYGIGFGGTLGFVAAKQMGAWALAFGGSFEQRSEYTPIEISLDGGTTLTKIKPGSATHATVGGDRLVGANRLSVLLVADMFTKDAASTGDDANGFAQTSYTLGPQLSARVSLETALNGWRQSGIGMSFRSRSAFSDASGASVDGSSATYVEASFGGVRGRAQGRGLVFGADVRYHSGMSVTDALVGAALTAGGITVGAEWPMARTTARLSAHVQIGSFDTGAGKSSANAISLGMSLASRGQ
jgi:hypothetical protein